MKRASASASPSLPPAQARTKRRHTASSTTSDARSVLDAREACIPAVSVQRQAARMLIESADLVDARAAALELAAEQRALFLSAAAHARALSRLQTAVELATQLQIKWEAKRSDVRRSVRRKVAAVLEQAGGVHERGGRWKLSTAARVNLRVARLADELEGSAEVVADALECSRKSSARRRLAREKERRERRRDGRGEAARIRIEEGMASAPEPPRLERMEMPHQHVPELLWRMYEDVFAHPQASHRMRRAMQDTVETIRDWNPYFFLKTLYQPPPPASDLSARSDGRWEVRRSKKVDLIVTALTPLFHELGYRAQALLAPDPRKRMQAWHDVTATHQLVRRLALHFHFVLLHLYAVMMGRHDRKATRRTFKNLVDAAQSDEAAFRASLGLVGESDRPKDLLVSETYELAPELLVFMDAWRGQDEFGRIGDPVAVSIGFPSHERFSAYIPVFEDSSTASEAKRDAVQELGIRLNQLCEVWTNSPLGSRSVSTIRIEVLGVVEKTIKHRFRGILELLHKITLARWMERRERPSRLNWWKRLHLRKETTRGSSRNAEKASRKDQGATLVSHECEHPGLIGEGESVAPQREQVEDVVIPALTPSPAMALAYSHEENEEEDVVQVSAVSPVSTGLPELVKSSVPASSAGSPLLAQSDADALAPPKVTESLGYQDPRVSTPTEEEVVEPSPEDFRRRVKKMPEDLQQPVGREGFRAPESITHAVWLASSTRRRSVKSSDASPLDQPATTRLRPHQVAGSPVRLKDVYAWTDDEIDAHEREMERVCDVRNELLSLRDALTVVKLESEACVRLGCESARRARAASSAPLGSLPSAAVSVQARSLSATVAAFGEEIAMHGAAEALIKRPSLRVSAADSVGSSVERPESAASPPELHQLVQTLQTRLLALDEPSENESDEASARLADVGAANLALLRVVSQRLAAAEQQQSASKSTGA